MLNNELFFLVSFIHTYIHTYVGGVFSILPPDTTQEVASLPSTSPFFPLEETSPPVWDQGEEWRRDITSCVVSGGRMEKRHHLLCGIRGKNGEETSPPVWYQGEEWRRDVTSCVVSRTCMPMIHKK